MFSEGSRTVTQGYCAAPILGWRVTSPADAVGSAVSGSLVLTQNSDPDGRSDPGDSSEVQPAEEPVIVAVVGVGIRRQDRGQPDLHVQLERGGDPSRNHYRDQTRAG